MKDQVRESLERIIKDLLPIPAALQGTVLSVESDKATCKVQLINSELELEGVRLRSINDGSNKGLVLLPKTGSKVLIGFVNNNIEEAFVSRFSEASELLIDVDRVKFNNGEFGGLVKIQELIDRLNNIEKDLNNLKSIFLGWTPSSGDGGMALKTSLALVPDLANSYASKTLTLTRVNDIENENITHG